MKKKNNLLYLALLAFCVTCLSPASADEYDRLIKKYKKEIQTKSTDLEKLKKEIEQKSSEKERYEKEEKSVRYELNLIEKELNKLNSEITRIENEIRTINKKSKEVEKDMKLASMEITQWKGVLKDELGSLYKEHYTVDYLIKSPWDEMLRRYAIKPKVNYITVASAQETYSKDVYERYAKVQDNLRRLNTELVDKKLRQKDVCDDKAKIYSKVHDKRICSEEELKILNESSLGLKNLIKSLEENKKITQDLKEKETLDRKSFGKKKKYLPWPVEGNVVMKFGKTKHPALATYVISNGIKIQAKREEITAIEKGEVVYAQQFRSYGKTIIIDNGAGIYTIYGGLDEILALEGTGVKTGDIIGKVWNNKVLYFEISIKNEPQNPLDWLKDIQ